MILIRRVVLLTVLLACMASPLRAEEEAVKKEKKENHTGPYVYLAGGFSKVTDDTNARTTSTDGKFGNSIEPSFGFTFGYNITDWLAPELQVIFSTATGTTGGSSTAGGVPFTTLSATAREYAAWVRLNAKYSFLTMDHYAFNRDRNWKIYPFAKLGGVVHALFVNAPSDEDKVGAYGGGFDIGLGAEVNWKMLYLGLDVSNDFVFLQELRKTINGEDTVILAGGFDYQISVMGTVGVHF